MTELISTLQHTYGFDKDFSMDICQLFQLVNYPKNSFLVQQLDSTPNVFFIRKGLVREFYTFDSIADEENTTQFISENEFYFSVQNFLENKPSNCFAIAMEPVKALVANHKLLEEFKHKMPEINEFLFDITRESLIRKEKRNQIFLQSRKSHERYLLFNQFHPDLKHRVTDKNIASYLQINSSTLCRLKKAI